MITDKKFAPDYFTITYLVEEDEDGVRLDQFLGKYNPSFSREELKRRIKSGVVEILDRPGKHKPTTKLRTGDRLTMTLHKTTHEDEYWNGEQLVLDLIPKIIFEDDDLIVISKPPYMATHPTGKHLFNCATVHFGNIHDKTIHSIHRLDRETSGVLLLGKSPKTAQDLTPLFEEGLVRKAYFFMAKISEDYKGSPDFNCDLRMGTESTGMDRVYIHSYPNDDTRGKSAETDFKVLFTNNGYALGLAFPKTGRQHQIRVHAKANGLPLVGDKLYLGSYKMFQGFKDLYASKEDHDLMELPRHALHAVAIYFDYKGEKRLFKAALPKDFLPWIKDKFEIKDDELESRIEVELKNYFK
ncbi:MAG: RluA family pseudouridine synthase [Bacteriovoracaceae bacterium]